MREAFLSNCRPAPGRNLAAFVGAWLDELEMRAEIGRYCRSETGSSQPYAEASRTRRIERVNSETPIGI